MYLKALLHALRVPNKIYIEFHVRVKRTCNNGFIIFRSVKIRPELVRLYDGIVMNPLLPSILFTNLELR